MYSHVRLRECLTDAYLGVHGLGGRDDLLRRRRSWVCTSDGRGEHKIPNQVQVRCYLYNLRYIRQLFHHQMVYIHARKDVFDPLYRRAPPSAFGDHLPTINSVLY
jgi:hypothetical protein